METVTNAIIAITAAGLFALGGALAWQNKTSTCATVLGFAFLLAVLLLVSKFKHVRGFGFEAEMWDEKQVEAAALVDRLSATSEALSQQVALIASKLGLWSSALTNPELADLLDQQEALLVAASIPKQRRDELLAPVYARIELNYWSAARQVAFNAYTRGIDELNKSRQQSSSPDDNSRVAAQVQSLSADLNKLQNIPYQPFLQNKTLDPIVSLVRASNGLPHAEAVLHDIGEIDDDLKFFMANRKLRRRIDLDYLYR